MAATTKVTERELSPTMEMYLKTILLLVRDKKVARVKDIAARLSVTMPTVSEAIRQLKERALVKHESYGDPRLTRRGKTIAERILTRHDALTRFFTEVLHVESAVADHDACEMEHIISPETMSRLTGFLEFISTCQRGVDDVIRHYHQYARLHEGGKVCPECEIEECEFRARAQ